MNNYVAIKQAHTLAKELDKLLKQIIESSYGSPECRLFLALRWHTTALEAEFASMLAGRNPNET